MSNDFPRVGATVRWFSDEEGWTSNTRIDSKYAPIDVTSVRPSL